MDLELRGKVALVTGASRGIGFAVAKTLADEGCSVGMIARGEEDLHQAEQEIVVNRAMAMAIPADVTDPASMQEAIERISTALGPIEILINNAGGSTGFGKDFEQINDEDWLQALDLNLLSAVRITRAVIPGMVKLGHGSVVMVATDAAVQPDKFVPHYTASKAALLSLSKSLSRQYGPRGIRVNTVSPGMVETTQLHELLEKRASEHGRSVEEAGQNLVHESRPWITAGRPATPEEVASVIVFLVSPRASYVNGANYRVDSGEVLAIT